jgi:hypothetical protein
MQNDILESLKIILYISLGFEKLMLQYYSFANSIELSE